MAGKADLNSENQLNLPAGEAGLPNQHFIDFFFCNFF
jgi:hypothetical protein